MQNLEPHMLRHKHKVNVCGLVKFMKKAKSLQTLANLNMCREESALVWRQHL